jgi:hypothetical protein
MDNRSLRSVAQPAKAWVVLLARWGFIANAVVYSIVGALIVRWANGSGGRITDAHGALTMVRRESFGRPLLAGLAVGFFSYALWRIVGALADVEGKGSRIGGVLARVGAAFKGLAYAALGVHALRLAAGARASASAGFGSVADAGALGEAGLYALGIAAVIFGAYECYRGYTSKLSEALRLGAIGSRARSWIIRISRFGIAARGAVIVLLGVGLLRTAALGESRPPADAGQLLRRAVRPEHQIDWLFASMGVGLIAYALYLVVLARYREVRPL